MYYDYGQNLISTDGYELSTMNNLKELYVNDCCFDFEIEIDEHSIIDDDDDQYPDNDDGDDDNNEDRYLDYIEHVYEAMSNLRKYRNIFLFHKLWNKPLERVSIQRNAQGRVCKRFDMQTTRIDPNCPKTYW